MDSKEQPESAAMNMEKVIFGFFIVLAATLDFGFFIGDFNNSAQSNDNAAIRPNY